MTRLERILLWVCVIALTIIAQTAHMAYETVVKPMSEFRERVQRVEDLLGKFPIKPKPFRETEQAESEPE